MSKTKTFSVGGIHPDKHKNTSYLPIEDAGIPETVYVPVKQHIGAPAKILVKKGDRVKVGTMIADADGIVSADVHSPVSGEVIKVEEVTGEVGYLEKMIKTAVIVSEDSPEDEVGMNNTVDIYFEEDDVTETYKLVTTVRSNSLKNLISRESPLGAAIFGHKVGDRCEVHVNDNYSYFVQIKRIVNTMDDGTDELRKF